MYQYSNLCMNMTFIDVLLGQITYVSLFSVWLAYFAHVVKSIKFYQYFRVPMCDWLHNPYQFYFIVWEIYSFSICRLKFDVANFRISFTLHLRSIIIYHVRVYVHVQNSFHIFTFVLIFCCFTHVLAIIHQLGTHFPDRDEK